MFRGLPHQGLRLCWELFWGIFPLILGYTLYSWELFHTFFISISTDIFCITVTVTALKKLHHLSLCWVHYTLFWSPFWIYSSILWDTWNILLMFSTNALIFVGPLSNFDILWCFWSILHYVPHRFGKHLLFWHEFLLIFLLQNIK